MNDKSNIHELAHLLPSPNQPGRVTITDISHMPDPDEVLWLKASELPSLNNAPNDLVSGYHSHGSCGFTIKLTEAGRTATGVRGDGMISVYTNVEYDDATLLFDNEQGEQRIDLYASCVKEKFGSLGGIFRSPVKLLLVINPSLNV